MAHTPGPWTIQAIGQPTPRCGFAYMIRDNRNCALAEVGHTDAITDGLEAEDNARLIAAAPELLEALETILGEIHDDPFGFEDDLSCAIIRHAARTAIAKATEGSA